MLWGNCELEGKVGDCHVETGYCTETIKIIMRILWIVKGRMEIMM